MGLAVPEFAQTIGHIVTEWPILEEGMITVLAELLGGAVGTPARQIFRSLNSERARLTVMRSLLHQASINRDKGPIYDEILDEFAALNKERNTYVHSLWITHESTGKTFIEEATPDNDFPFLTKRPISIKQSQHTLKRIRALTRKIHVDLRRHVVETLLKRSAQQPSASDS